MKHRLIYTLVLSITLFSLLLAACASPQTPTGAPQPAATPSSAEPEGPRLRVRNNSAQDIKGLAVMFPDQRIEFGDVPAGSTTEFMPAPGGVYNYGAYEYSFNGEMVTQPVIDWMGESPRPGNDFTYVLEYDPEQANMMRIQLVEVVVEN